MRLKTRYWFLLSILLFAAAYYFWQLGNRRAAEEKATPTAEQGAQPSPRGFQLVFTNQLAPDDPAVASMFAVIATNAPAPKITNALAYRLTNTKQPLGELVRNESAVLLRHAFIDTSLRERPEIPAHLRAQGDPGSYVVQVRGGITPELRNWMQGAGAEIVSYVPNNAFLVRASAEAIGRIGGSPFVNAVLPFEPYYKFDPLLLPLAVKKELSPHGQLNVVSFPGQAEETARKLESLGAEITREPEPTMLGEILVVKAPATALAAIAQIPEVHMVGVHFQKTPLNDLARVSLRVSRTTTNGAPNKQAQPSTQYGAPQANNFLTGNGILVGIVDTGVDEMHPDLTGRVAGYTTDFDGHGTHVAGSFFGDGSASPLNPPAAPSGSDTQAIFYGTAPGVQALSLNLYTRDRTLQQAQALTNILISNNSWGFPYNDYDIFAASYDAAVRDSLPGVTGEQQLLYVFAAGNDGNGGPNGLNGIPGSILSPATAKNVISVGGAEQLRNITNVVERNCMNVTNVTTSTNGTSSTNVSRVCETNMPWAGQTDSDTQIAGFSSRGNVGIGIEGPFGRIKPDVVAPGAMVVSTRSRDFVEPTSSYNTNVFQYNALQVDFDSTNLYSLNIPGNAVGLEIFVLTNRRSPTNLTLEIGAEIDAVPTTTIATNYLKLDASTTPALRGGTLFYTIANNVHTNTAIFDLVVLLTVTNDVGNYYDVLRQLNEPLKPHYRYESGTSMAAPLVSGMLALFQEYLQTNFNIRPSPALLKALVINGARSIGPSYNLDPRGAINHQGWGIANMSNSIPYGMSRTAGTGPLRFFDQNTTNALATGGSHVYTVSVPPEARSAPLRMSLVWTDPPGNPISSTKLVNDLNLFVTGTGTNAVAGQTNSSSLLWVGNNFAPGSDFTDPIVVSSTGTNANVTTNVAARVDLVRDTVNNVENVYIRPPLSDTYTIVVKAHRVNVNAINSHSNSIVQDYALVVSSGNVAASNTVNLAVSAPIFTNDALPRIAVLAPVQTNGTSASLVNQRVGANSALITSTNGATNQWAFFTYRNVPTVNFTNVVILTFLAPELSLPRFRDADIDLYVARSSKGGNTNLFYYQLDANQITNTRRSVSRTGTEFVLFDDAQPNEEFYIGVKSEDQQAANFGIYAASSDVPFSRRDASNNIVASAITVPMEIPDGSPDAPGGTNVFVIVPEPNVVVQRVYVTNSIFHEEAGDLIGILTHRDLTDGTDASVTLNNHRTWNGLERVVYDDSDQGDLGTPSDTPPVIPPDGPGSLQDFQGQQAMGVWSFNISDNALFHTGRVEELTLVIEPASTNETNLVLITRRIPPGGWLYAPANVPFDAFNMEICTLGITPDPLPAPGHVEVYARRGSRPTRTVYDHATNASPPGMCWDIGLGDNPPLTPGRWFIGIHNPTTVPVTLTLRVTVDRHQIAGAYTRYVSTDTPMRIIDNAVTNSTIFVSNTGRVNDVRVGVRIDHERASDVVLHLTSPAGTRLLLAENRGRTNALGYGADVRTITTNFGRVVLDDGFEKIAPGMYIENTGTIVSGWRVDSDNIDVWQYGIPTSHTGTNCLDLNGTRGPGSISTNVLTKTNQEYLLTWVFCRNNDFTVPPSVSARALINGAGVLDFTHGLANARTNLRWLSTGVVFRATSTNTRVGFINTFPQNSNGGMFIDTVQMREIQIVTNNHLYTTFTENTNLTATPIKFGIPPFTNSPNPARAIIIDEGFDAAAAKPYGVNEIAAGWLVEAGSVDVTTHNSLPSPSPTLCLDLDGSSAGTIATNVTLERGATYELSFAFTKNSNNPSTPAATVQITGVGDYRVTAVRGDAWTFTNIQFVATSAAATIRLRSEQESGSGVFFDSFKLQKKSDDSTRIDGYFLPEESMRPFFGEDSLGPWTLEVWDNRAGGAVTGMPRLVSWKLEIAYPPTNPPVTSINNGLWHTNLVRGGEVRYFVVDVPCPLGFATNTLICLTNPSSGLDLVFNQYVLPTNGPNDVLLLSGVTGRSNSVLVLGQPPLVSPNRYYLAVRNTNPAETNPFALNVAFKCEPPIPALTNYLCSTNVIAANEFDLFTYTMRPNVLQATFRIVGATDDLNLYVRYGSRPAPQPMFYDYVTNTSASGDADIVVTRSSSPRIDSSSQGFTWFLGVTNVAGAPVDYCVQVIEVAQPDVALLPFVEDTNTCVYSVTTNVMNSTGYADYFQVRVPPMPSGAFYEVDVTGGDDVDLYVRNDYWPWTNSVPASRGMDPDQFNHITTPALLTEGNWFISVVHTNPLSTTTYTLTVRINAPCSPPAPLINVGASSYGPNGFTLRWRGVPGATYMVQYTDSLSPAQWANAGVPVSSDTGEFEFHDDGSQTGGRPPQRFYRLLRIE